MGCAVGLYQQSTELPPGGPTWRLGDLAEQDERWERLLSDSDGIFTGTETIEETYCQFLTEVLVVMERYDCTFTEAVKLSGTGLGANGDPGVADYLRARRAGMPEHQALVYNLKALHLGPPRAALCAWRRNGARAALERGRLAAEAAEASLAKGLACSDLELAEVDETISKAQELCFGLERALEILQANSVACGEGEGVLAEYEELFTESEECNAKLLALADSSRRLCQGQQSKLSQRHQRLISSVGRLVWPACFPSSVMIGLARPFRPRVPKK